MKLLIITHTLHKKQNNQWFAYGPYIREMNLWEKHADELIVVAPLSNSTPGAIDLPYKCENLTFYEVPAFSFTALTEAIKALIKIPGIVWILYKAMRKADHIHLRCPGNMGLLGCLVQVFFPKKKKTAKYAGNWDPTAQQPLSYRFQKWILNNSFLTRNMQVMVYGNWPNTSKNIAPFFTATYSESKKQQIEKVFHPPFKALFVGGLTPGKDPLYALKLVHQLQQKGIDIGLEFYGEGVERQELENYIASYAIEDSLILRGNRSAEEIEQAYTNSHFLILPSKSEGWPKAVAEAMFLGCVPLATPVSCVPEMLGQGERGVLLTKQLEQDVKTFYELINEPTKLTSSSQEAQIWSQQYTLEAFEGRISNLI
jgi:glycosyltransferase involved in cell wall biosynthesis